MDSGATGLDAVTLDIELSKLRTRVAELEAAVRQLQDGPQVADPTATPDPRRWGTVVRGLHAGERVYWDASLHARRQHAWINVERTRRYLPEEIQKDRT